MTVREQLLAPVERVLSRRMGTPVGLWPGWRIFCLNCSTRIPYRAVLRRTWKHTACESCEGYSEHMTAGAQSDAHS